jgi:Na+/melibiose symporter-like transporter
MIKTQKNFNGRIALFDKIGYGSGNLGFGIVSQIISAYLVFYATAILGISGSLVGSAISISVIWDAVTDPVMGYLSDITQNRKYGRRHLYILIGTFGTVVSNLLLWMINPDLPMYGKFLWVLIDILILKTFTTIYVTPYTALGAELSTDYNERTSIQGIKMMFFLVGLFLATVMGMAVFFRPTAEYITGQLNPDAYKNIGITSSAAMLLFGLVCYYRTKKYIPLLPGMQKNEAKGRKIVELFKDFVLVFKNNHYRYIVFGYLFTNIATALAGTLGMHVFTYTFGMNNNEIAIIIGVQLIVTVLSQPVWVMISKRIDKKPSTILGLGISIFGTMIFGALVILKDTVNANYIYLLPYALLVGFGTGCLFSLPYSMIADTIDVEELNTGKRTEGTYYGCLTLFYKLSQSVAIFLMGVLLDIVRFNPNLPTQSESTLIILGLTLPVGSILAFVFALIFYGKYKLDRSTINDIQIKLNNSRNETPKLS